MADAPYTSQMWIDRITLKNRKHEAAPAIRMNDDAVTRYSSEIGKIKNLDNIAWKKLALNDARFSNLKRSIEINKQMLVAMGEALDPLTRSQASVLQEQNQGAIPVEQDLSLEVAEMQNQSPMTENAEIENH